MLHFSMCEVAAPICVWKIRDVERWTMNIQKKYHFRLFTFQSRWCAVKIPSTSRCLPLSTNRHMWYGFELSGSEENAESYHWCTYMWVFEVMALLCTAMTRSAFNLLYFKCRRWYLKIWFFNKKWGWGRRRDTREGSKEMVFTFELNWHLLGIHECMNGDFKVLFSMLNPYPIDDLLKVWMHWLGKFSQFSTKFPFKWRNKTGRLELDRENFLAQVKSKCLEKMLQKSIDKQ